MNLKLVITEDGSHSIAVPALDEHYHSIHGAISESQHIFINAGLNYVLTGKKEVHILEIGFGTGLNALLSLKEILGKDIHCEYTGIELHPVPEEIFTELNYAEKSGIPENIFYLLHKCPWNKKTKITENFILNKLIISAMEMKLEKSYFDLVYFDAFGPDKQPEIWTEEIFKNISGSVKTGGILTTYSTKGNVKRILKSTGFKIEKLPGPKGKREILRAIKSF